MFLTRKDRMYLSSWLAASLALLVVGCDSSKTALPEAPTYTQRRRHIEVQITPASRQSIAAEQQFTGDLLPRRMTRIAAQVNGVVAQIPQVGAEFNIYGGGKSYSERLSLTYGQRVNKGDLLVQLDPRDFEVDVQIAVAKLAKAKADLDKLLSWERAEEIKRLAAMHSEAVARFDLAKRNRDRLQQLVPSGAITQAEFEQCETEVATASAIVDSTNSLVEQAQAGPTPAEIAVQRALLTQAEAEVEQKKIELSKTTIVAPYDGVVTAINVEVGERVAAGGDTLVELMDLSYLVAEVNIPEAYVGSVQVKDLAKVLAAGTTGPVPGVVIAINEMVDPATRTFRARVAIDNADAKFKAGQFAKVSIPLRSKLANSLVVPARSLVFIEGQPHVFVVKGGKAVARRVALGLSTEETVEITSGLTLGEEVITDDPTLLSNGVQVSVQSADTRVALRAAPE